MRDESGREQTIKTTNEHPFYRVWKNLPDAGEWIESEDLRAGDKLRSADGELVTLIATEYESHPEGVAVYNVEVEDLHSYFVPAHGSRAPPVLSHNQECGVKNPWGRKGSSEHRARIAEVESSLDEKGWKTVSGGTSKIGEKATMLDNGKYRFADLVMENKAGKTIAVQVGQATKGGLPVARERRAIKDLRDTDLFDHVWFFKYKK